MTDYDIKGWCPGALRPMASGDGLVLRIRARNGRLTPDQAQGIAGLARQHGNGLIDLTSRANLQLRDNHPILFQTPSLCCRKVYCLKVLPASAR